jgi:hypothetical protein
VARRAAGLLRLVGLWDVRVWGAAAQMLILKAMGADRLTHNCPLLPFISIIIKCVVFEFMVVIIRR